MLCHAPDRSAWSTHTGISIPHQCTARTLCLVVVLGCGSSATSKYNGSTACEANNLGLSSAFDVGGVWELDPLLTTSTVDFYVDAGVPNGETSMVWLAYDLEDVPTGSVEGGAGSLELWHILQVFGPSWANLGVDPYFRVFPDSMESVPSAIGAHWAEVDGEATLILERRFKFGDGADDSFVIRDYSMGCRPLGDDRLRCQWLPPTDPMDVGAPTHEQGLVRRPAGSPPSPLSDWAGLELILLSGPGNPPAVSDACPDEAAFCTEADCVPYASALAPCLEAAGVDVAASDLSDNQCLAHRDLPYAVFFACATEALLDADCSTGPGFHAAHLEIQRCHRLVQVPPW